MSRYNSSSSEKGTFDVNNVDDVLVNSPIDKNKVRQAAKLDTVLKEIYANLLCIARMGSNPILVASVNLERDSR